MCSFILFLTKTLAHVTTVTKWFEENCPPTPKLTLSQTLTLFSSGAIVWLLPNPKTNPDLDPNPNPYRGAIFLRGQLSGYLTKYVLKGLQTFACPHKELLPNKKFCSQGIVCKTWKKISIEFATITRCTNNVEHSQDEKCIKLDANHKT